MQSDQDILKQLLQQLQKLSDRIESTICWSQDWFWRKKDKSLQGQIDALEKRVEALESGAAKKIEALRAGLKTSGDKLTDAEQNVPH